MENQLNRYCIFIPCYKAATTIAETLEGVQDAIKEAKLSIPVYIYEDCGGDNSIEVAKAAWVIDNPLIIEKNEINLGERKTTNKAFKLFQNKYDWAFIIHADDIPKKNWITDLIVQINQMSNKTTFSVWSSFDTLIHESKKVIEGDNSNTIFIREGNLMEGKKQISTFCSSWHLSGCSININLYHQIGGFDEAMPQYGDLDIISNALIHQFNYCYIGSSLTYYRQIENSVSAVSVKTNRDIKEVVYMAEKYKNILNKKEIKMMYKYVMKLSFRRIFKAIKLQSLGGVKQASKYFFKGFSKQFIF